MKNFLKSLLSGALLYSVIYLVLGVILILVPELALETLVRAAAVGLLILGAVNLIRYWARSMRRGLLNNFMATGLVLIGAGIVLLINPALVTGSVPMLLGIAMMVDGLVKLQRSIDLLRMKYEGWIFVLVMAVMVLATGTLILLNPFAAAKTLTVIIGVGLAFAGLMGIVIWIIVGRKVKKVRNRWEEEQAAKEAITVEAVTRDVDVREQAARQTAPKEPVSPQVPCIGAENVPDMNEAASNPKEGTDLPR